MKVDYPSVSLKIEYSSYKNQFQGRFETSIARNNEMRQGSKQKTGTEQHSEFDYRFDEIFVD
jgi:hypothetical protein